MKRSSLFVIAFLAIFMVALTFIGVHGDVGSTLATHATPLASMVGGNGCQGFFLGMAGGLLLAGIAIGITGGAATPLVVGLCLGGAYSPVGMLAC